MVAFSIWPVSFHFARREIHIGRNDSDGRPAPGVKMWSNGGWTAVDFGTGGFAFSIGWSDPR